ncbi:MAG: hypothetical protein IKR48_11320 [Kiritimatiellae bacterium]|nr:hypothetical protein [Kiritimatiellia bacterium]
MPDYPMKETIHSMLRRCVDWDYTQPCIYMITVVLADRQSQALGAVIGDGIADHGTHGGGLPTAAHCELTDLGKAVEQCWEAIPRFYPQIQILGKQVMPDHFHGILWVKEPLASHLGHIIKGFKLGCNKAARRITNNIGEQETGLFAEGFQDTILFSQGQLEKMISYIKANPLRLAIKRAIPGLFTMVRNLKVSVMISPETEPADQRILHFTAIGNRSLLKRPMVQVQCSRRYLNYKRVPKPGGGLMIARDAGGEPIIESVTHEYEELRDRLLATARHGAVLISPCISDGERQIAREALKAGLPLVTMQNKGFSKLQKPSGRYFDACAAGQLLMLAPAAWPYIVGEKRMTRDDALAMNRLCQWLAGEGAASIDYKGRTPINIDRMALDAARGA